MKNNDICDFARKGQLFIRKPLRDDDAEPPRIGNLDPVRDAPDQVELNQPDLSALLERGLVSLERRPSGTRFPRVTTHGSFVLRLLSPAYFHAVE